MWWPHERQPWRLPPTLLTANPNDLWPTHSKREEHHGTRVGKAEGRRRARWPRACQAQPRTSHRKTGDQCWDFVGVVVEDSLYRRLEFSWDVFWHSCQKTRSFFCGTGTLEVGSIPRTWMVASGWSLKSCWSLWSLLLAKGVLKTSDSLLACARYTKQSRTGSRNPKLQPGKGKPKQNENCKTSLFN